MNLADQHDALPFFFQGAHTHTHTTTTTTNNNNKTRQTTDVVGCLKTRC